MKEFLNWEIPEGLDTTNFDFSWKPDPYDPPYIHQFGTQWQKTGGPRYVVPGATEIKYQSGQLAKKLPDQKNRCWRNIKNIEFDYSWHPDDTEPPMIYQFASQWYQDGGPRYVQKNATTVKYVEFPIGIRLADKTNWEIPDYISTVDTSWHPPSTDTTPYIYQFQSPRWSSLPGPRYVVPGASQVKYMNMIESTLHVNFENWEIPESIDKSSFDFSWIPPIEDTEPFIYQFGTQWQKTGGPRYVVPGATQIKYVNFQYAKIAASDKLENWHIPSNVDCADFDFSWHPDATEPPLIYEFGTQWQKTGGPRYVVPGATQVKYINAQKVKMLPNPESRRWRGNLDVEFDWSWHPDDTSPPYIYQFSSTWNKHAGPKYVVSGASEVVYVDRPIAKPLSTGSKQRQNSLIIKHWVIPADIDDRHFDYSWLPPEEDTEPFIYQFGTQWQKTGGPRYVVPGATQIKYVDCQNVIKLANKSRWMITHNEKIKSFDFSWHPDDTEEPYIYVFGNQYKSAEKSQSLAYFSHGASQVKYCNDQVAVVDFTPLDIIFVSNGEEGAEERYGWLSKLANRPVKRVTGVIGRENALIRAAEISDTEFFFVFPGKLRASENFDFDFRPDPSYDLKHYIFYAQNPVNKLCYGHMAAVCYNRKLVLDTVDYGLDFTMSQPHDIVPIVSGIAEYNDEPIMTWRTAFRESIKLQLAVIGGDKESADRLKAWKSIARGKNAEWSVKGANDGVQFFNDVNGNVSELMKSFSWSWLAEYFNERYSV